jgi:hypothetical protein
MIPRSLMLILSAFIFSGCSLLDYVMIADSDTDMPEAESSDAPPALQLTDPNGDMTVDFDLGSYCWTGANVAMCVDMIAPEYSEDEHLAVGDTLELQFAEPYPNSVSVSLYPGSNLFAQEAVPLEASMDENGHILVSIPENLQGLYVLAVFGTWDGGDASYTLPIRLN